MGEPGNHVVKRTHSLFVDDLKVYHESHKALKIVNEIIVQASHDTGASMEYQSVQKSFTKTERWLEEKDYKCWKRG